MAVVVASESTRVGTPCRNSTWFADVLKGCLSGSVFRDGSWLEAGSELRAYHDGLRRSGLDWPALAPTMIGRRRLDNLHFCVESALREGIPGDLIEAGVWRGGATILMRAILALWNDDTRRVWVADSFEGLPPPDSGATDARVDLSGIPQLAVSQSEVEANFRRFGLLDDQVQFLPGWFRDTLPTAPIDALAVLRVDGDIYDSVRDALVHLYPKLSPGGYVIIDDYFNYYIAECRAAVDAYRHENNINERLHRIDALGAYWRRSA